MSMWYEAAGVLILKDSVWPTFTLIDVAKPWIVWSPSPLTCQSLGGSPGSEFSQAITLVTGGPHGPAAKAGRAETTDSRAASTMSMSPRAVRRSGACREKYRPCTMCPPYGRIRRYSLPQGDAQVGTTDGRTVT